MEIRPTNNLSQISSVDFSANQSTVNGAKISQVPQDQVELSMEAQLLSGLSETVRTDRVAEIKSQIASGIYESSEKLNLAVERMLDEIA